MVLKMTAYAEFEKVAFKNEFSQKLLGSMDSGNDGWEILGVIFCKQLFQDLKDAFQGSVDTDYPNTQRIYCC